MLPKIIVFLFFLVCAPAFATAPPSNGPHVNAVGCSLFDEKGSLLRKYLGWVCAYFPNGKMLLGDGFTLTFYDEKMRIVWSRDVHTHHMINFDPSAGLATVIASNVVNGDTRIDRLEVYDTEGNRRAAFNFGPEHSATRMAQNWDNHAFPYVKHNLTMIESFYRVGKNSSRIPYLAEGNFVAYDAAGFLYVFDHTLSRIEKKINVREWGLHSLRDVQVTPAGNFLFYNSGHEAGGHKFTALEERRPRDGKLLWSYRAQPPESFYGAYEGNVQLLANGNLLFSVVMDEWRGAARRAIDPAYAEPWHAVQGRFRAFEVTRAGRKVWEMSNDGAGLSGMPNVVKRLDLGAYVRAKGGY